MNRRSFLEAMPFIMASAYSCDIVRVRRNKTFTLNVKEILRQSRNVGTVVDATLYLYPSKGDSIRLLSKGIDEKTEYNIADYDSLEFGETSLEYEGKPIYGIVKGFKKSK